MAAFGTSDPVSHPTDLSLERLAALTSAAALHVKSHMEQNDGSHDWWHIERVRGTARRIAAEEGLSAEQVALVDLSALLHDVEDWKYVQTEGSHLTVKALLQELGAPEQLIDGVQAIITATGFKEELAAAAGTGDGGALQMSLEAKVMQDADRLDAIGAIGIARCFTFGGRFNRALYDPAVPPRDGLTKEEYMANGAKQHTINHFYEKLLKLKGMMKTDSGRRLAEQRHQFMELYLETFFNEWNSLA